MRMASRYINSETGEDVKLLYIYTNLKSIRFMAAGRHGIYQKAKESVILGNNK